MGSPPPTDVRQHPFVRAPHRTLVGLSVPVLLALVAEPITGLVDTAFVARVGTSELAALGVGAIVTSSVVWVFNFLGIATQTEVAKATGGGDDEHARGITRVALHLAVGIGALLAGIGWFGAGAIATAMGAGPELVDTATEYLRIRLLGTPAVLVAMASFGALRGRHHMHGPMVVAIGLNVLNVVLDWALIFGAGPVPALGIRGAAWASTISWFAGAFASLALVRARLGRPAGALPWRHARRILTVGGDMFVRTSMLVAFLLLCTRQATALGVEAGAAHQVIRQVWTLTALVLDAYATVAQSLVGYFLGGGRPDYARRAAKIACQWSLWTGVVLAAWMVSGRPWIEDALLTESARAVFGVAWWLSALAQPINALSFATDGVHWGAGDYRFLRNAMVVSTAAGVALLFAPAGLGAVLGGGEGADARTLGWVWATTGLWVTIRATFGVLRIWPGLWNGPLAKGRSPTPEP